MNGTIIPLPNGADSDGPLDQSAIILSTNVEGGKSAVFALGDIGRLLSQSTNPTPDAFDDLAIVTRANGLTDVDGAVEIHYGQPQSWFQNTLGRTISRTGPTSGYQVRLTPTTGDYDGDGRADLAILETVSLAGSNAILGPISGTLYVYYNINDPARPVTMNLAADADVTITSNMASGLVNRLAIQPNLDWNADGRSDLLVGATFADVVNGSLRIDAGRVFAIEGGTRRSSVPTSGLDILTNRTISGSGDYVVDRANGQAARFDRVLQAGQTEQWHRFTTLGDGDVGNAISVSPYLSDTIYTQPISFGTILKQPGAEPYFTGSENSTGVSVGGGYFLPTNDASYDGMLTLDLSSALQFHKNPDLLIGSASLRLRYDALALDYFYAYDAETMPKATLGDRIYFAASGAVWESDGTLGGTHRLRKGLPSTDRLNRFHPPTRFCVWMMLSTSQAPIRFGRKPQPISDRLPSWITSTALPK